LGTPSIFPNFGTNLNASVERGYQLKAENLERLQITEDRELNKPESSGLNHRGTKNTKVFLRGFGVLVVKFQVIKSAFLNIT
jgi:hypothetical protein